MLLGKRLSSSLFNARDMKGQENRVFFFTIPPKKHKKPDTPCTCKEGQRQHESRHCSFASIKALNVSLFSNHHTVEQIFDFINDCLQIPRPS
ncbi:hypothetical protein POX_a00342 [Penicillium oxalicum]|uniref:Uncharacterized protein n=1 Tax=Penicillium oxalicum (strain 114-2 / CGMCC 5302) TaxID=933388 RepID=S8A0M8_PENO1|nr:hypothetical protein POX_a00342 [Penicillium oxalicum]EPS34686.1 hypothetical protein PDE_09650 [Penicillium oxalicum 114-2]KAI2793758.1 hypothetical protein POX_a00342 [Penicillium oxalicum]